MFWSKHVVDSDLNLIDSEQKIATSLSVLKFIKRMHLARKYSFDILAIHFLISEPTQKPKYKTQKSIGECLEV
jgi:hypothetical protein